MMRGGGKKMLNAFVFVLVTACFVAQMCGIAFRIRQMASRRANPDDVSESALDTDGDDQPDLWKVNIGRFGPHDCKFTLEDSNSDGAPDLLTLVTAHITCKMFDDDKDGRFDRQLVELADIGDENSRYDYHDLDLDGRLDVMEHKEADETAASYVFMKDRLVRAQVVPSYDPRHAWITQPDGSQRMMVFENGAWKVSQQ